MDFAFELAGSAQALKSAYGSVRAGGSIVIAGLAPQDARFEFSPSELVSGEISISGSYMGSCVPVRDVPRFIAHYKQGRLPIDRLLSQTVSFDEMNEGFDRLSEGTTLRQILLPHGTA